MIGPCERESFVKITDIGRCIEAATIGGRVNQCAGVNEADLQAHRIGDLKLTLIASRYIVLPKSRAQKRNYRLAISVDEEL